MWQGLFVVSSHDVLMFYYSTHASASEMPKAFFKAFQTQT